MAPSPHETIDEALKKTIHSLYTLQSSTHGYLGPETQTALVGEVHTLSRSLAHLHGLTSPSATGESASLAAPLAHAQLPPEIIEYVDAARNPDIYTREFVELVQRGNAYLKGKGEALEHLRDRLADEISRQWPELRGDVEGIVGKDKA